MLDQEIKELIISTLGLEDITAADIESSAPLFGDGLGLDSIDALELGIAISKKYNVTLDPNSSDLHAHFASVSSLVNFINNSKEQTA
ncbi:MAG TPA: phosphopantetheine-binding protein [Oligoflexia bacterium]|nr:phosphopantetheine-binding protein [Oligoflexia bacterium]HMP48139.1 phosphopantetheine-binding protein [Oligoflexia bacterium]